MGCTAGQWSETTAVANMLKKVTVQPDLLSEEVVPVRNVVEDIRLFCSHFASLHIDKSRRDVLEHNAKFLSLLASGNLKNENRFRQLLLGRKAVGKSSLLNMIRDVTPKVFTNVECVLLSLESGDAPLPSSAINEKLNLKLNLNAYSESERISVVPES